MKRFARLLTLLLTLCLTASAFAAETITVNAALYPVAEDGAYSSMEEVAVYIDQFGKLPGNFIRKSDAQALGWNSREGNLGEVAPGMSIGGDHFGNYEGTLPDKKGRKWTECDIDADGGFRNGKRIAYSNDGLIYYSDDHYNTFRLIEITREEAAAAVDAPDKHGEYTQSDDVAAYLHAYGELPENYITREEAKKLGWSAKKDNLGKVAPGMAIGGDTFGNHEGLLPEAKNRKWRECDVNMPDGQRGDERVVWSTDGLIYFTDDNHKSFTRLY